MSGQVPQRSKVFGRKGELWSKKYGKNQFSKNTEVENVMAQ